MDELKKDCYTWDLVEVLELIKKWEPTFAQYGLHLGLTGSVLFEGISYNDVDFIVYPHKKLSSCSAGGEDKNVPHADILSIRFQEAVRELVPFTILKRCDNAYRDDKIVFYAKHEEKSYNFFLLL